MRTQKEIEKYNDKIMDKLFVEVEQFDNDADQKKRDNGEKQRFRHAFDLYLNHLWHIRMHMFKSGPRFKVGDMVWHYGCKGVERAVVDRVFVTTTSHRTTISYGVMDRGGVIGMAIFGSYREEHEVFATRKEARAAKSA